MTSPKNPCQFAYFSRGAFIFVQTPYLAVPTSLKLLDIRPGSNVTIFGYLTYKVCRERGSTAQVPRLLYHSKSCQFRFLHLAGGNTYSKDVSLMQQEWCKASWRAEQCLPLQQDPEVYNTLAPPASPLPRCLATLLQPRMEATSQSSVQRLGVETESHPAQETVGGTLQLFVVRTSPPGIASRVTQSGSSFVPSQQTDFQAAHW